MPPTLSRSTSCSSSHHTTSTPWGVPHKKPPTIHTIPRWKANILEEEYVSDPWPSDADQEIIAKKAGVEFHLAFGWFAARRAKSIGLPTGCFVVTLPAGCPREHLSWRLEAAEFMEQERRAAEIEKAQCGTTIYSKLTGNEPLRFDMPPAEGRCQSGTNGPSERFVAISVGHFMQLQAGSPILQEPLQYELQDFSPQNIVVPEEDPVDEGVVPDDDMFTEYLNDLSDLDNSLPISSPPTETSSASSN